MVPGALIWWLLGTTANEKKQLQQCLPTTTLTTATSTASGALAAMWFHVWRHAVQVRAGMLMSRRTQSDPDLGRLLQRGRDAADAGSLLQPQCAAEDTSFELRVLETALDVVSIGPASCVCQVF